MSATELYNDRRKQIELQILELQGKIQSMDIEQAKNPKNYGYSGNAMHILSTISDLNDFMSGY